MNYDDGTDRRYEWVAGELVEMPPESRKNAQIPLFLLTQLLKFVPVSKLSNKTEIVVSGACATTCIPDLMMVTDELLEELQNATHSTIALVLHH